MTRPWTCPVCKTVLMLGPPPPSGKIRCPTCDTEFVYPLRREAVGGGDDRDEGGTPREKE